MRQPEWRILWVVADVNAAVFEGYSALEMRQPEWRILWVVADGNAAVFEGYSAVERSCQRNSFSMRLHLTAAVTLSGTS